MVTGYLRRIALRVAGGSNQTRYLTDLHLIAVRVALNTGEQTGVEEKGDSLDMLIDMYLRTPSDMRDALEQLICSLSDSDEECDALERFEQEERPPKTASD